MALTPAEIAAKWSRNLSTSTDSIRAGVEGVTEAPTQKAKRRIDAMVAGIQRAAADGSIAAGLDRVSLEDWKSRMLNKGLQRIASGAAAAQGDFADFMADFMPHIEAGKRKLDQMPRGDLEANINRAIEMMRHNSQFRRRR